jgi:hypothetical protein
MTPQDFLPFIPWLVGGAVSIAAVIVLGVVHNTRLKIKHGYPLEGMWGQSLKPGVDGEAKERIKLLTQENAQLRAELGSLQDRLINVERIVTDSGYRLGHEIESLREDKGKVQ